MSQSKTSLTEFVLQKKSDVNKPLGSINIDRELVKRIRELKNETGWTMQEIAEDFIKFGLMRVEVADDDGRRKES